MLAVIVAGKRRKDKLSVSNAQEHALVTPAAATYTAILKG
jgi:hypothetical protein